MFRKQKPGWFGKQLKQNIEALRAGDTSRIPFVFCVFSEKHAPSKLMAAKALNEAMATLSFNDMARIDIQMRQSHSMQWGIAWDQLEINDFFTTQMDSDERRAISIFASFNSNGFIREKAVQAMKNQGGTLAYIILRLNDWVSQVQQAASDAFAYRLQCLSEGELFSALTAAEKLKRSGRGSHHENINRFLIVLTSRAHAQDLMAGLQSNDITTRRFCTDALLDISPPKTELALEQLTCEPDPFLRAMIFKRLNSLGQNVDSVVGAFLCDKHPINRILALHYLVAAGGSGTLNIAQNLLLDRSGKVREAARHIIQKQTPAFDFRGFYRSFIDEALAVAIDELGKIGLLCDAEEIAGYIGAAGISVVKSAMASLMRLNSQKYGPMITEMLGDNRASIVKTARNLVLKYGRPDYERTREIFHKTASGNTRSKCADILFTAPKWQRLIYILEAISRDDEQMRKKAFEAVNRWRFDFNRSFTVPSNSQQTEIRRLIHELNGVLSDRMERELLFFLPSR
ncbi:hypothetical protein LJC22_07440 [Desulfosarcina sp. OttesenSCG-928-G10]|nr:hypothetical protein [Desulfosarcina sp. OttesenSCG-928-G10]MDL2321226.1 hypothetical protein [Desulfosarcina sp. OttesenSCG-928-B08]